MECFQVLYYADSSSLFVCLVQRKFKLKVFPPNSCCALHVTRALGCRLRSSRACLQKERGRALPASALRALFPLLRIAVALLLHKMHIS